MPALPHNAIVIVLDIGKSVSILNYWEEKTFFEQSRECVSWIIQRKLISKSIDVLSLILIGSDHVNNSLAASGYKNISCKFDFQQASWEMLKFVEVDVRTTENASDWIGALVVSMEMLKVYEEFNNVESKKIVFFSDFTHPASDDLDVITNNLKNLKINISIIGPDNILYLAESQNQEEEREPAVKKSKIVYEKSQERQEGEELVYKFWRKLPEQIIICTFESALKQLCSYTRKPCRKTPWNCILDIGNVKISISMFKKTDPQPSKKFDTKYVKPVEGESGNGNALPSSSQLTTDEIISVVRDKVMHYKHEAEKDGEFVDVEVKPEDTIEGFRYGVTVIPFSDEDKAVMSYKPGPKSFSVLGFTDISSVPFYLLSGDCSYVVSPRDKDYNAEVALSALIQAMKQMKCLAIVRKVYSNDRGLSLGVLHPFIEEIVSDETDEVSFRECLLFVELAFEEEVKSISFPSLEKINNTEEQFEAIDELIEEMDLMNAGKGLRGEPCEAFDLSGLHDFKEQFFHYCVIQRGLYPEKPLPKSLPSYIEDYVKLPKSIEDKCKVPLRKLKERFKIVAVEQPEKIQKPKGLEANPILASVTSDVEEPAKVEEEQQNSRHFSKISIDEEPNPLRRRLMNLFGESFPANDELEKFLSEFFTDEKTNSLEIAKEFESVISIVREKYLNKNPDLFNWWIRNFKYFSNQRSDLAGEIWNRLVSENLGLITKKENDYSTVSEDEGENFLHMEVTKSLSFHSPETKKSDFKPWNSAEKDLEEEQMVTGSLF